MATSTSSTRMPHLGVFASKAGPSRLGPPPPLSRDVGDHEDEDGWYIPYNGPYEERSNSRQRDPRDSWGDLLNGWLSEEEASNAHGASARGGRGSQAASAPEDGTRSRVISGASRQTRSTGGRATQLRSDPQPRMPTMSFINLHQDGGVGESPVPPERSSRALPDPPILPPQQQAPPHVSKRGSLASIFTFGRKSMRLSVSMEHLAQSLKRERANTDATPPPPAVSRANSRARPRAHTTANQPSQRLSEADEYYNSYYSTLLNTPGDEARSPREEAGSHPYAYPFPETTIREPHSAPAAVEKGKGRLLHTPKISFNLLDSRGASKDIPAYLKPSPRNSLLKASISTPNLRNIPKGKQRWWAAETWCDAIILPRPRFALRFVDPSASGRIVSPPPSPIMFPSQTPTMTRRPELPEPKSPKKVKSMGNMIASAQTGGKPGDEAPVAGPSTLRAPRPKSFAWDDLALPSPVPSLAKVLEEGKQLNEQRQEWQTQASRSYLDRRAGTMARARSKSIGAAQVRPQTRSKEHETAFERLAERTLLGNQTRQPTIHIRGPSVSKNRERSQSQTQTQTQTQTGTAHGTIQSTTSQIFSRTGSRARSHAHSNSLGNSWKSTSNESGGGHSHSHSIGKSAFKLVVSTAALCGLSSPSSETGIAPPVEGKEHPLRYPESRFIYPQDRARDGENDSGNVIVISPTAASAALAMVSRGRENDLSPTPSALSGSAEGVGIAITLPSDDHSRQQGREPIRIPAHPYAQNFAYNQSAPKSAPPHGATAQIEHLNAPDQLVNRYRQPVLVHPYSQPGHPYASPSHPTSNIDNPPPHFAIPSNPNTSDDDTYLYAELTPGSVQEFSPKEIRYSPDVPTPLVVVPPQRSLTSPGHPYGPASKRTSELGFGEALINTMRRTSVDSGLGTSESGGGYTRGIDWERPAIDLSPEHDMEEIARIHQTPDRAEQTDYFGGRPVVERQASDGVVSYQTTSSSPPENLNPPALRRTISHLSPSRVSSKSALGNSAGSSPGMISHDSSPPLSPRPINVNEDLDRYRDLFYRPTESAAVNLEDYRSALSSRRPSGSIPVDVSSQSSRSALTRSGLSDLARQLSEDLEELRRERGSGVSDESQRWGRRYGGLRGSRPEDMDDPNVVLAQLASDTSSPGAFHSPLLRLPIDTSFVSPSTNIPEDIESSRASSILELASIPDDPNELVRMGEVEAVLTPPIISSPQRFSTELSLVGHDAPVDRPFSGDFGPPRIVSQHSTLRTPITPNTRSSYMTSNTDISRMSGLSDFPAPPSNSHIIPPSGPSANNLAVPPRLVRELSYDTFGRQTDDEHVGEAL